MGAPFGPVTKGRRRDEALAFIVEQLVRTHSAPTLDDIATRLKVSKSRSQELVAELIAKRIVGRRPGSHTLYIIDMTRCRHLFVEAYRQAGGWSADAMGQLLPPTNVQLPVLPPFRHLPDVD